VEGLIALGKRKLRLVILGMMGRCPFGGQTWLYLNWLRAFSRLGHDVWYVDDDSIWPYDPEQDTVTDDCRYAVRHISSCMERIGLADKWAFRLTGVEGKYFGQSPAQLRELYRSCDALLSVVGATDLQEEHLAAPMRIYVETDPVTAELRLAGGDAHTAEAFGNHHLLFTYGENYGAPDCGVPLSGRTFLPTRQPIDLDLWPVSYDANAPYFTTIGNYRQKGNDVEYNGQTYRWSKHHEWEKIIDLPRRTKQQFELAMNADAPGDREFLESHGWRLTSPLRMSLDIFGKYPDYFRRSRAQLTVAKDQNVRLRSGWFSERDVCYLASGKPVVSQDTGFTNIFPTGQGLFGFSTLDEALAAVEAINADYPGHCRAARQLAADYFDAPKVGAKLLQAANLI
jgi:hypothetical protein